VGTKYCFGGTAETSTCALGLFLDFRFYLPKKTIEAKYDRVKMKGKILPFKTKLSQAAEMIVDIGEHFSEPPLLAVTDSWFGNAAKSVENKAIHCVRRKTHTTRIGHFKLFDMTFLGNFS
jgi:hypothetical protein